MASIFISPPGSKYGPCDGTCQHTDCQELRTIAASVCALCEQPIGYDQRFCQDREYTGYVHEICLIEAIEKERNL